MRRLVVSHRRFGITYPSDKNSALLGYYAGNVRIKEPGDALAYSLLWKGDKLFVWTAEVNVMVSSVKILDVVENNILWLDSSQLARASSFSRLHDHSQNTTLSRTPLDE